MRRPPKLFWLLSAAALLAGCSGDSTPLPDAVGPDYCAGIERGGSSPRLATQLEPVASLMAEKTGVYVLEDGAGAMMARAWLGEYAEQTIDVQYFIFSTDNVGLIAADYLVRAAERGVRVRILVDDMLVEADGDQLLAIDAVPNLEVRIYNPGMKVGTSLPRKLFKVATDFRDVNQRMHNKTFTVDGKVTITGGRNIADEYFDYDHEYNFRDRDVLLLGGITAEIQKSFEQFWNDPLSLPVADLTKAAESKVGPEERIAWLHQYACNPDNYWPEVRGLLAEIPAVFEKIRASGALQWVDGVSYVSDPPGKNSGEEGLGGGSITLDALTGLVRQATTSVNIETPYLVTTEEGRALFREVTDRGVEVRILTNSLASTDNLEAFNGYQRDREKLLKTGVKIFEFRPDAAIRSQLMKGVAATLPEPPIFALHAKSMVIDGHTTVIGTFNLDPRSANLNTECFTMIPSETIAASVLAGMEAQLKPENAWETTLTANPDSEAGWVKRFKCWTRGVVPKSIL